MTQTFVLAPPPQTPRRRASRPNIKVPEHPSQSQNTFVQPASIVNDHKAAASPYPSVSQASTSTLAVNLVATTDERKNRSSGKSFARRFKSPFSKSSPSSPERPAVPALPAHLAENVAAVKQESKSSKKSKSKAAEKPAEKKVKLHANSKNERPVTYQTAVQLNMLLGGGSQEYWLAHARKTGVEEDELGGGEEVGGFKDEDGQIWWDMEEKAAWTSLLPKDSQGVQATSSNMWVEFDTDHRRNSTSSGDSTLSYLSAELAEEVDGPILYGDADYEQAKAVPGIQKGTGTVLFPIDLNDEPHSPEATEARGIISQANGMWTKKSEVQIADGFEDHFLSYGSEAAGSNRRGVVAKEATVTMSKPAKKGILKGIWNKSAARD